MFQFAFVGISAGGARLTLATSYDCLHEAPLAAASASLKLESDGDIIQTLGATPSDLGDWIVPKGLAGGDYEARMVTVSGTLSSGTADTWQALSSDRSWGVSAAPGASKNFTGTLEIGRAGASLAIVSAAVTLTADGS